MFTDLLDQLGGLDTIGLCLAVAILAFGETAIMMDLVVPGEVGLVLAGAAAATGDHSVVAVVAAAAIGATLGDTTSYVVGRRFGRPLIDRFAFTRRRLAPVIDRAEAHFDRHGGRAVFFGRFVGALRAVVPFVAGVARLRVRSFIAWNAAASLTWASAVVSAGAAFGRPVASTVDRVGVAISVVAITVLAVVWVTRRRSRARSGLRSAT